MRKKNVNQIIVQLKKEFIYFEKSHNGNKLGVMKQHIFGEQGLY